MMMIDPWPKLELVPMIHDDGPWCWALVCIGNHQQKQHYYYCHCYSTAANWVWSHDRLGKFSGVHLGPPHLSTGNLLPCFVCSRPEGQCLDPAACWTFPKHCSFVLSLEMIFKLCVSLGKERIFSRILNGLTSLNQSLHYGPFGWVDVVVVFVECFLFPSVFWMNILHQELDKAQQGPSSGRTQAFKFIHLTIEGERKRFKTGCRPKATEFKLNWHERRKEELHSLSLPTKINNQESSPIQYWMGPNCVHVVLVVD